MTFHVAAEEARRLAGEAIPIDLAPHGERHLAITRRVPIGPVAAISPFNFPLNLTAHKIAPAIAAGNPIGPEAGDQDAAERAAARRARHAGWPAGWGDQRAADGAPHRRPAGHRPALQAPDLHRLLGGRVGHEESRGKEESDPGTGRQRGGDRRRDREPRRSRPAHRRRRLRAAGQSCISVQRVYVHGRVFDEFAARLVPLVEALKVGDPLDPATDVGPMIEEGRPNASTPGSPKRSRPARASSPAAAGSAAPCYAPTVMRDVPADAKICAQEVFAPLVGLYRCLGIRRGARRRQRFDLRPAGGRVHVQPRACAARVRHRSTSAASSSMTFRPGASTTCRMAA